MMATTVVKMMALLALFAGITAAQGRQNVAIYMVGEEPAGARGAYKVLGGELAKAISGGDKYTAIDRTEAIQNTLSKEHVFQRSGAVSDEQIKELGRQLGAQYICIVELSAMQGGSFYIDMRLVDVVTARIINTATASSSLKGSSEMVRTAQQIARELVDAEGVKKEMERKKVKKTAALVTGISLDVLGAGALAYGLYENYNASGFIKDKKYTAAEDAIGRRNLAYTAGCVLLLGGISVHIFF
jgi:hypothetical protein